MLGDSDPGARGKEIVIKLGGRLRKQSGDPKFKELAERLEDLKNKHEQGLLLSIDFLKALLELAKQVVQAESETPSISDSDKGKAALTELLRGEKREHTCDGRACCG